MADTNFRGPITAMGSLEVQGGTAATVEPLDGPSALYQGFAYPDLRIIPFGNMTFRGGQTPGLYNSADFVVLDNIPQARGSALVAAAQIVTAAVACTLVTAQSTALSSSCMVAIGVPIVPVGTTVATVAAMALDFGFATGTTVTNSTTVTVVDNTQFKVGQWLVIGGVGNANASKSHICQVASIVTGGQTAITVLPAVVTGLGPVPIGQGNLWGSGLLPNATQFGPAAQSANAHAFGGGFESGLMRLYNPREMLSRNISIQGVTALAVAYSAVVSGWDVWGNPMTEVIGVPNTSTWCVGKKAFKYISSITSGTTVPSSQTVAFGLGDTIGLPIRCDYWEEVYATWNGVAMANFSGISVALTGTSVANSTTDVRGTLQLSTAITTGALLTAMSVITSNGTGRIFCAMSIPPAPMIQATPLNPIPLFGVSQYTATS